MKRAILLIIQIAVVVVCAMFLIKYQLPVSITIDDYVLTTTSSFFIVFLFIFMGVFAVFYKILEALCYGPRKIKQKMDHKRTLAGLEAIINGLFFLSNFNNKQALKQAKRAGKKIPKHVMTHFLAAKTYMVDGNFGQQQIKKKL